MTKRQTKGCAVAKGRSGQAGSGEVERVPAVAVVQKEDPSILESIASLHNSERDALAAIEPFRKLSSFAGNERVPQAVEVVFDGMRFDVVFADAGWSWKPASLLDIPPSDDGSGIDGGFEDYRNPDEFMTRKEALEFTIEHNREEERKRHDSGCRISAWAVMVEVGQQVSLKTLVDVEIHGIIGMYRQEVAYPVRVAKLSPEEIERYRIEAANEEPAVA